MTKTTIVLATFSLLFTLSIQGVSAQASLYCNASECFFWTPQPEEIDSQVVTYAQNVFSIDEWDNALGCAFFNQCENLKMLVYSPKLQPGEKRPLVVLIHGGGFISGDYTAFQSTAKMLAELGYVTATINYRLCKRNNCLLIANTGCLNLCNANYYADFGVGSYVAAVDAKNAIRYLQDHAAQFHIDPENVIVGGHSAGAITAMNVAFMDQAEANSQNTSWQANWGALNPVSGIKGVVSMSGAVFDTSLIDVHEPYPVFALHGTCDPTVCYDYDAVFHCNNSYPKVFGGRRIAERMQQLGHPYYLLSGMGMGHDIAPLQDVWMPEAIRFMRSTMLCGNFTQKHSSISLSPESAECTLLQFDIAGCNLQYNHVEHQPSPLPISPVWGGPPAPCGNGLVAIGDPKEQALITVHPTNVDDMFVVTILEGLIQVNVTLMDSQGKGLRHIVVRQGSTERVEMAGKPAGTYFLRSSTPDGSIGITRLIKL